MTRLNTTSALRAKATVAAAMVAVMSLSACGNAQMKTSNLVSGNSLQKYIPAVDLAASRKTNAQFQNDLAVCRGVGGQAYANASDRSGQRTLTSTIGGTVGGAVNGYTSGSTFEAFGFGADKGKLVGAGAISGAVGGMLGGLSRTNTVVDSGKRGIDNCLRGRGYLIYG